MKVRISAALAIALFAAMLFAGCSSSGMNPVFPQGPEVSDWSGSPKVAQTHLWGLYEISIDPSTREVTVIPCRQAMFTVNVVNFLNGNVSNMAFKINDVISNPSYTDIDIDVTLKHPFPGLHQYDGYDVRGVFMGDGSESLQSGNLVYAVQDVDQSMFPDPDEIGVEKGGPDGYTRWFNFSEFSESGMPLFQYTQGKLATQGFAGTATLNPYKYFADGLGVGDDLWTWLSENPEDHGVFSSGAANTRNYYLRFPSGMSIVYGYAVLADWHDTTPEAHPSNAEEAIGCKVVDNSTVYYVDPGSNGGNIALEMSIWDWHAELSAGMMEDYTVLVESSVLTSPYEFTSEDMTPVGGGEHFSTYHVDIPADNVQGLDGNEYWVLVRENGIDYSNQFGVPNLAEDDLLTACFRYPLEVSDISPECPTPHPTAISGSPKPNNAPVTVTITCTGLYSETGISAYLDLSGALDGVYDITGTDIKNVDVAGGTFDVTFDLTGVVPGEYYVVVTNSCGETGVSDEPLFTVLEYLVGDIYVSNHPDFDGLPEEGTMEHPFHTINGGINAAEADDLILVDYGLGKYPETIYFNPGEGYVTIRAYNWHSPSGRPTIGGTEVMIGSETIGFFHAWNVTIQGFKITFIGSGGGWWQLMDIIHSHYIVIKDCYFTGDSPGTDYNLAEAIGFHWSYDTTITNCLFKNINAGTSAADTYVQVKGIDSGWSRNLTIEKCEFTDFQTNAVPEGKSVYITPIDVVFDYGNFIVRNNLIHHITPVPGGTSDYVYFRAIENVWPLDNGDPNTGKGFITNNTIDSISLMDANDGYLTYAIGIYNLNYDLPGYDIDINSNILTNMIGKDTQSIVGIDDMNFTDYTNIWHVLRGSTEYPWANPADEGVGCIFVDPLYVNNTTAPYNYHLQAGSPCIGTGKDGEDMGCYGNLGPSEKVGLLGPED